MELSTEALASVQVPLPPVEEQRRIADFLDDQVARIDTLLAEVARMQSLGKERLGAAVTYGVSSGDLAPLKRCVWWQEGPGILADSFRESGTPVLRIANVRRNPPTLEGCNFVDSSETTRKWSHFLTQEGDLLVSGSASSGQIATWVTNDIVSAIPYTGLIRTGTRSENLVPDYLRYFFVSGLFEQQIDALKTGVGIQHWGPSHLSQVFIRVPSVEAQVRAVQEMAELERGTEALEQDLQHRIDGLEERKRALITAAVTGELDVSTARPIGMGQWVPNVGAGVETPAAAQASSIGGIG